MALETQMNAEGKSLPPQKFLSLAEDLKTEGGLDRIRGKAKESILFSSENMG